MASAMLRELAIRNLAVLEEARVVFAPGLNVLTGETGAGKSIVIDALLLIRGARAQPDLIRTGAESASVEAVFDISSAGAVAAALDEAGHAAPDGQLVVKRELSRSGRNRVFVNDSAATVALLERLGDLLVEIHGQHEHQRLMEPVRQLDVLDRFAGCGDTGQLAALWRRWERRGPSSSASAMTPRGSARRRCTAGRSRRSTPSGFGKARRTIFAPSAGGSRTPSGSSPAFQEVMDLLHEDPPGGRLGNRPRGCAASGAPRFDPDTAAPIDARGRAGYVEDAVARARGLRDRAVMDPERLRQIDERLTP
jgi:hypothetical protein